MKKNNVLVCVTGQHRCERLIIAGAKAAEETGGRVYVLHVARPGGHVLGYADEPEALEYLLSVSVKHGADMVVIKNDDVTGTILRQVGELGAGTVVSGRASNYSGHDLLDDLQQKLPGVRFQIQ